MKTLRSFLPLVMMLFAVAAWAKDNGLVTKTMTVKSFDAIEAEAVDVRITVGQCNGSFTVTGTAEDLEDFKAVWSKGKLKLTGLGDNGGFSFKNFFSKKRQRRNPVVKITVPSLRAIDAGLSSSIQVDKPLRAADFDLHAETSASVSMPGIIAGGEVEIEAETSSSVSIDAVSASELEISSETSASAAVSSVKASDVTLDSDSSASMSIGAITAENVKADASTSGSIHAASGTVGRALLEASTSGLIDFIGVKIDAGKSTVSTAGSVRAHIGK